eukprot:TRINITY_DN733_c0_g1_i1.p1 TRINITY_DN733_c0_g1~~TRINITY_DN733_c0_g1_i1.p1  ORF type:complete len:980 (+),score=98.86 TRINITY_DN733_c0_g1_i1:6126-9065(+)
MKVGHKYTLSKFKFKRIMQVERQCSSRPLAPFSPNTKIENKSRPRKDSVENADVTDKCSLNALGGRTMYCRRSIKRKENFRALDPLKSINKIISECEDAVQQYVSDSGPVRLVRGGRSHSFKNGPSSIISNSKCFGRVASRGYGKCIHQNEFDSGQQIEDNNVKKRNSTNCIPTRKKSLKITGEIPGITNVLLKKLYEAKCADIQRQATGEQERRFIEFCTKVIKHRKLALREVLLFITKQQQCGLGTESSKVLATILKNNYQFAWLDLSENNIGLEGLESLCDSLRTNHSLISVNLAGNNINSECAGLLFDILKNHPTITEVNVSNNDKLHKNRIGPKGCFPLKELLQTNRILTVLNIAENAIGAEGLKCIIEGLNGNKVLLSLNLSNNNLPASCIYSLTPALLRSGVRELILRHNDLVDRVKFCSIPNTQSMDDLALLIYKRDNILERIDVSNNKVTYGGANLVFRALSNDKVVKRLNMALNELNGGTMEDIERCIKVNKGLEYLNLFECKIGDSTASEIGTALSENKVLKTLILGGNLIEDDGGFAIGQALVNNETLKELDLSCNHISDKGLEGIVEGIIKNKTLDGLNLSDNRLGDASGQKLLHAVTQNMQLKRLKLAMNTLHKKHVTEIEGYIKKNVIRAENERRALIVSQFALLKQEVAKSSTVKQESEAVVHQKKKLKEEILEDVKVLNEAQENKDKDLDYLRGQLEELFLYEKKLDTDLVTMDNEIKVSSHYYNSDQEKDRKIKREVDRHMHKLQLAMESTSEVNQKVEEMREQFKSAEFQHRIELGEISEALNNFKTKKDMWAEIVEGQEKELTQLKRELGEEVEEPNEEQEQKPKKKVKKKTKNHKKPPKTKFVRECKKCGIIHNKGEGSLTPKAHTHHKCLKHPKKRYSEKQVVGSQDVLYMLIDFIIYHLLIYCTRIRLYHPTSEPGFTCDVVSIQFWFQIQILGLHFRVPYVIIKYPQQQNIQPAR